MDESAIRGIVDMLAERAWRGATGEEEGEFLVLPSDLAPGEDPASLREALGALYRHARRRAPGLEIPFFVPPIRIATMDSAGLFGVDEELYASVTVAADLLDDPAVALMILAHEACHHILRQSGLRREDDVALNEITTDLAMFVCGFGELVLRGHTHVPRYGDEESGTHLGYLSSEEYRKVHDYVLAKRIVAGLSAHRTSDARASEVPAPPREPEPPDPGGAVELWCGEAMCKRAFRATLRRAGDPWPVQCPACGVFLYPSDVLRSATASELAPQHAELLLRRDGRLAESTAAALRRLARAIEAPAPAAPAEVDGAAILAEMIATVIPPHEAEPLPSPLRKVEAPTPVPVSASAPVSAPASASAPVPVPVPASVPAFARRHAILPTIFVGVVIVAIALIAIWVLQARG